MPSERLYRDHGKCGRKRKPADTIRPLGGFFPVRPGQSSRDAPARSPLELLRLSCASYTRRARSTGSRLMIRKARAVSLSTFRVDFVAFCTFFKVDELNPPLYGCEFSLIEDTRLNHHEISVPPRPGTRRTKRLTHRQIALEQNDFPNFQS
jgi:hypothetical protein